MQDTTRSQTVSPASPQEAVSLTVAPEPPSSPQNAQQQAPRGNHPRRGEIRRIARLVWQDLAAPAPRRLTQRQVRRLNRAGRLLADTWGEGELQLHDSQRWVWATAQGPAILITSRPLADRAGRPKPGALIRAIRWRVSTHLDILALEKDYLLGQCLDAANGDLTHTA